MKKIYLFCSAGMSTSMLASNMQSVANAHNLPIKVAAFSHNKLEEIIEKYKSKDLEIILVLRYRHKRKILSVDTLNIFKKIKIYSNLDDAINYTQRIELIKNCKKHYFSLVNNEGFNIDDSTEYMSCDLSNLKLSRVKVIDNKYQPTFHKYKRIGILNYLIQNDKAFFILKKDSINGSLKEYMVEIYFFNKINNNWIFYKKILLSNT